MTQRDLLEAIRRKDEGIAIVSAKNSGFPEF